jgi:hypothetical protein
MLLPIQNRKHTAIIKHSNNPNPFNFPSVTVTGSQNMVIEIHSIWQHISHRLAPPNDVIPNNQNNNRKSWIWNTQCRDWFQRKKL